MILTRPIIFRFLAHLQGSVAPATLDLYGIALEKFRAFADRRDVTKALVLDWRAALLIDCKASSANKYMGLVKGWCAWAVECDLLPKSPMPDRYLVGAEPPDKKPMTVDDCAKITNAIREQGKEYWGLAIRLAWATGLRLSDVALLDLSALDREQNVVRVRLHKTCKHGKDVEVPIPPALMADLPAGASGAVFPTMAKSYRERGAQKLCKQFARIARRAGVAKTFHSFRHGFVTRHLGQGVNPAIVAELSGMNLNQLMTYLHSSLETKRAALNL